MTGAAGDVAAGDAAARDAVAGDAAGRDGAGRGRRRPAPMTSGWKIEFGLARRLADAAVAAIEPHVEAVSVAFGAVADDGVVVTAFGTEPPDEAAIGHAVGAITGEAAALAIVWLPEIDWVAQNRATFRPIRVGPFFVHDSGHRGVPPAATIPLLIDANTAFGTGAHATTAGCLAMLGDLARRGVRGPILDLGCGTGVLALAAARRLGRRVLAADCDGEAVTVAARNVRRNRAAGRVTVIRSDGYRDPRIHRAGPYGLVLANILARPLAQMAPDLARHLRPAGRAVLSGLLADQERQVLTAHLAAGLSLERRLVIDGWATLLLRRRGRVGPQD